MVSEQQTDRRQVAQERLMKAQDNWLSVAQKYVLDSQNEEVVQARQELDRARRAYIEIVRRSAA